MQRINPVMTGIRHVMEPATINTHPREGTQTGAFLAGTQMAEINETINEDASHSTLLKAESNATRCVPSISIR